MTVRKSRVKPYQPDTLKAAHEYVPRLMPAPTAPLADWVAFRRRSAAIYTRVADVDRGHHHEALYWAELEARVAAELADQLKAETATKPSTKVRTDAQQS